MIKINTGKKKIISFDIDIEGGNSGQIKEGRFILSCLNKKYKMMFKAIIEDGVVTVSLPSLDINEKTGECSLEIISNDNQYYPVFNDSVKFERNMKIRVTEQKEKKDKPIVEVKIVDDEKKIIKEKKVIKKQKVKPIIEKSSKTIKLYRTIKCDKKIIENIVESGKFGMKPKGDLNVKFYNNDSMLLNDLELVEYGVCVGINVPVNGIIHENKDKSVIVNSSYLDIISDNNVLFLIKNGVMKQLEKNK